MWGGIGRWGGFSVSGQLHVYFLGGFNLWVGIMEGRGKGEGVGLFTA